MGAAPDDLDRVPEISHVTDEARMAETVFSMHWRIPLSIVVAGLMATAPGCWYIAVENTKIETLIEQQHEQNVRLAELERNRSGTETRLAIVENTIAYIKGSLERIEQKLDRNLGQDRR